MEARLPPIDRTRGGAARRAREIARSALRNRALYLVMADAIAIGAGAIAFQMDLPFDVSYNLLPYKNWVETGRFEHRIGDMAVPFEPNVSTGPTVNLPVALTYLVARTPAAFFWGVGWTLALFWAVLLWAFYLASRGDRPVLALVLLIGLLGFNREAISEPLYFTTYGELPATALVFAGMVLLCRTSRAALWGASAMLAAAVLTKNAVLVGLAPVLVAVYFSELPGFGERRALVRIGTVLFSIAGLLMVWRVFLPYVVLSGPAFQLYRQASADRRQFEWHFAVGHLREVVAALARGDGLGAFAGDLWRQKIGVLSNAKRGVVGAIVFLCAGGIATTWLLRSPSCEDRAVGRLGLFGLAIGLWWLGASALPWYRHLFVTDLALSIAIAYAAAGPIGRCLRTSQARTAVLSVTLYVAAAIASATTTGEAYAEAIRSHSAERRTIERLARRVIEVDSPQSVFYVINWYEAPQVQLLARNDFRDVLYRDDVLKNLAAGRSLYFVQSPQVAGYSASDPAELPRLLSATSKVLFDEVGYRLIALDSERMRQIALSYPVLGGAPSRPQDDRSQSGNGDER